MAESCIVCLGDLVESRGKVPKLESPQTSTTDQTQTTSPNTEHDASTIENDVDAIAHLLPCNHHLHNDCLKPWVERANSCPICRRSFNMVELKFELHGPCITSYGVQDKQQTAEIDPSMIVEEELFELPCLLCTQYGPDEDLLLCDSCNGPCHTYCAGLEEVPAGAWFCPFCHEDGSVLNRPQQQRSGRTATTRRRRGSSRRDVSPAWARVWQSVWDNLNLDLEFPFDEEETGPRSEAQRREFEEWQQRFRIAERQGGAARFRDTAATLLERNRRTPTPHPESQEELRAWNALEKAKQLKSPTSNQRRKRKSPTASPAEPEPEPERKLKRPRTRRVNDISESSSNVPTEIPAARRHSEGANVAINGTGRSPTEAGTTEPSFFQSLLKEVEMKPQQSDTIQRPASLQIAYTPTADKSSPGSLSPGSSPSASNMPSPRDRSASPVSNASRPTSPTPLTSHIKPIFTEPPAYSPVSPSIRNDRSDSEGNSDQRSDRKPRSKQKITQDTSQPQSKDPSPNRGKMSYSAKEEIQQMVSAALKPAYKRNEINTDQFTKINKAISRMLYDRVGEVGGFTDGVERDKWIEIAAHEVDSALKKAKDSTASATVVAS